MRIFILIFCLFIYLPIFGQNLIGDTVGVNYNQPREYEIGGLTVTGATTLDANVLKMISGLTVGKRVSVPGEDIAKAIENLWEQGLFADVGIFVTRISGDLIFLEIEVEERPRLSNLIFEGDIKKSDRDELREKLNILRGQVVTHNLKARLAQRTRNYYIDKGYLEVEANVTEEVDSLNSNNVIVVLNVKRNKKVKIEEINFIGNTALSDGKLRRTMKETKEARWYGVLKPSKFIEEQYEQDKNAIIAKYNSVGYRDARIIRDSVYTSSPGRIKIDMVINEGEQYYFRNIEWVGNSKYSDKELNDILGIKKGEIYDQGLLESRLYMNPNGRDVSSLYMDDGYLFFSVTPAEVQATSDSIDIEMRIYEGQQARINNVTISGNTKTHDHVIMREIRTKPGDLFSRSDVIRTQRELANLGYFNPEKLSVTPKPNPADGTVDIDYVVEERPSDQLELSGGWGAGRVVGTLGLSFNNFSARSLFKKGAWRPLPSGDGQRLSIRAQSTGLYYQSYSFSFTEPWLGGKKPNALSISLYNTSSTNGEKRYIDVEGEKVENPNRQGINISGFSVGLGKRLKWPDDYFTLYTEIGLQRYNLDNYQSFIFTDGISNNLSGKVTISRNSIDQLIYPRSGAQTSLTVQATLPYSSIWPQDYSQLEQSERYKWTEYHKWKFTTAWYNKLAGNLVLYTKAGFGFLGMYDRDLGITPFERFSLGGSGMTGAGGSAFFLGKEIIALRGYDDESLSPSVGGAIISKYTMELRYPISLNPNATVYVLGFAEAGKTWNSFRNFNPFNVYRTAGAGVRVYLPMFGLLGLDYGFRLDEVPGREDMEKGRLTFSIGFNLGEL